MAPVVEALNRFPKDARGIVCVTGQHRELLNQVLSLFDIQPDVDLKLMQHDQSLSALTARLVQAMDNVIAVHQPDWIIAQGDTTTVMATALVAYYKGVRFGHVEAGLRTGDLQRPFPEEMNRRVADLLASLHFAPTERCRHNLLAEGIAPERVLVTGNTVVDALLRVAQLPYDHRTGPLSTVPFDKRLVLVTAHRRESFGNTFMNICEAIRDVALHLEPAGVHFVYPVHPNPNVRRPVERILSDLRNVSLLEPLEYQPLIYLMKQSTLILTDSGGIQEEAPSFGIPVFVLRDNTERQEGVDTGIVKIVGTSPDRIRGEVTGFFERPSDDCLPSRGPNPYGDGMAAERIVARLIQEGTQ